MNTIENRYNPDRVSPPGDTLREVLDQRRMDQTELSRRIGLSRKHVASILRGGAPIVPTTALALERALGIPAHFWNAREQQYQEWRARRFEEERLDEQLSWLKNFACLADMQKLGWVAKVSTPLDKVRVLLEFFAVASPDAWEAYWKDVQVAYRKSSKLGADRYALAAWLRKGELEAREIACAPFDASRFRSALSGIRALTLQAPDAFCPRMVELCAASGVATVFVPELPKTASGATRWVAPDKALIQLSLRYKTNDHFWFTFFHEAAHVLLHQKKAIFIESESYDTAEEQAANRFASDFLIPERRMALFLQGPLDRSRIVEFADDLGIAPGIVVGQLQHGKRLNWKFHNGLKQKFTWKAAVR